MAKGFALIGDPAAGRPTLGDRVPVVMFRALRMAGMMEGLNAMIGDASTLVYSTGKGVGTGLGETILWQTGKDMGRFLSALEGEVRSLGIGIVSIITAEPEHGMIAMKVDECITCSGGPVIDERVCHFEAGFIAGLLEPLLGKTVNVVETQCNCMGEDGCEFECRF